VSDTPADITQVVELPPARASWRTRLRRNLLTGLVILVPVALTAFILVKIFTWGDNIFGRYIHKALDPYLPGVRLPGLGFVVTVLVDTADLLLVFVPTTPNPTSGFLLLVPRKEAIDLPISVEEGVRMVISGGLLLPSLPPAQPRQMPVRQP
jgi:uncharacterized membrane protein